jgi:hypothetical protein
MNTHSIKATVCLVFALMATLVLQAQNNVINWGSPRGISGDSDVSTVGTLVGTYSPYLILNPSVPFIAINGVTFQSNSVNAVTSGMTNSTAMGINPNLTDPNYADLLSGASDTPFNTDGAGYIAISNLTVGATYQIEVWAEDSIETTDQWENLWEGTSSDQSSAVNYNVSGTGNGQYVIGTFMASNSVEEITWNEWANANGSIGSAFGQGQINLLQLRQVSAPAPQVAVTWGSVSQISGDSDVVTNQSSLVGTYAPYLILNPGTSSITVNGVAFQSNTLNAVTVGMTNSANMGVNPDLGDPNYADLLSGASDTPFNTPGVGYILFSNVVPGNEYEIEIWAQDANLTTYDQWENFWTVSSSDQTGAVNYDNNGNTSGAGLGEFVTGTFTPTVSNSVVQISWDEWCNVNGVNSSFGQGQVNLLQLRVLQNPPTISQQPAATTDVAYGTNATLTAVAGGSPTLAYQWYETNLTAMTGFAVPNATNASLTLSNITANADYYLVITNDFGSTNTVIASVVVYQAPLLVSQLPVSYTNPFTLYAGANPAFSVSALGLTTLGYQWFTNGVLDAAATNPALTLKNVQVGTLTNYCIVTDSYGSVTSVVWTASVIADPTNSAGGLASYPQAVLALNPIGYWRMNDTNLDGVDGSTTGSNPGDFGWICHDYVGGNDGLYTNCFLGLAGYNPVEDPSDTSAQFGESADLGDDFGDSLAFGIQGINFGSPANTSKAFTIEAWASPFEQNSDSGIVTLGWGSGGEQFNLDCGSDSAPTTHGFRFFIRDAAGNVHAVSSTNSTPTVGQAPWYHLVGVVDEISNQSVTFYINGQSVGSASCPSGSGILASTYPMGIGARMSSQTTNFNDQFLGNINDVAVYNYALSPSQVAGQFVAAGGALAPFFSPTPATNVSAAANSTLTIPVTALGTPPLSYFWTNVTTAAAIASGTTNTSAVLNAGLNYPNVPANWNGNSLELTVSNAYGTATLFVTPSIVNINLNPTNIVFAITNHSLALSWPSDHTGWQLQAQTNNLSAGLKSNWANVGGSTATNMMVIPINLTNGCVFYRLVYP